MSEKKANNFESPNVSKLQAVAIDNKTTIYIAQDADPEEAKKRYLSRINRKAIVLS
jgi:ribosomal protein L7Ae-like RNA K-turn-binding protein